MTGLLDVSPYVPAHALPLASIGAALGRVGGRGVRAVAGFDEDATTMAVAAVRGLSAQARAEARSLWLATTHPPYLDKTNATAVHLASGLEPSVPAYDAGASLRSAMGALRAAATAGGIAALADLWGGMPGGDDERSGGDGAVALAFGDDGAAIATVDEWSSHTLELLERWRLPQDVASQSWDDRFGAEATGGELRDAIGALLGSPTAPVQRVVVSGANSRTVAALVRGVEGIVPTVDGIGYTGTADVGLRLLTALELARPGERILVIAVGDGLEAVLLTATERITAWQAARPPLSSWTIGRRDVAYTDVLRWRGHLETQAPRRPEPQAPAAPPSYRGNSWKFGLQGGRCESCGTVHAPVERHCRGCGAVGTQRPHRFGGTGRVATLTVDHLAYSPAPPTILAVVDLGDGARAPFEVADVAAGEITLGDVVEPTFRRMYTAQGVHDYFWKVRPPRATATSSGEAS